jgi:hypothetical protein
MKIIGPDRYRLKFDSEHFDVISPSDGNKFSGYATSKLPKLYIVSVDERPIYVGITVQPMRNRLRYGWRASGESGYHGYAWRHEFKEANLDIWYHLDAPEENKELDFETVEAEVVFLIRSDGQWPSHQTEIHFHKSTGVHRKAARAIYETYRVGFVHDKNENTAQTSNLD